MGSTWTSNTIRSSTKPLTTDYPAAAGAGAGADEKNVHARDRGGTMMRRAARVS